MWSPCISLPSAAITSVRHTPDFTLLSANFVELETGGYFSGDRRGNWKYPEEEYTPSQMRRGSERQLREPTNHLASSWRKPETTCFYPIQEKFSAKQSLKGLLSVTSSFLKVTTSIIRTVNFAQNAEFYGGVSNSIACVILCARSSSIGDQDKRKKVLFHMHFITKQWWVFSRLFETPEKYRKGQVQYISKLTLFALQCLHPTLAQLYGSYQPHFKFWHNKKHGCLILMY